MKILSITRKTLLEVLREPLHLGLIVFFPVALLGFYYMAFGQAKSAGLATYLRVLVVNQDAGPAGEELLAVLRAQEWEDKPIFDLSVIADASAGRTLLLERKAALLLVIPPDFARTLAAVAAGGGPAVVTMVGDPASDQYIFARSILESIVREFSRDTAGFPAVSTPVRYGYIPGTGEMSDFDFGVPGMIVFGIVFVMITTAIAMVREQTFGTLRRLRLTCVHARDLLIGVTLAQGGVLALQIPLSFGAALALGFVNNGSLLLAMFICALIGLGAVGVGLIIACFSRTEGDVVNLASVALLPLVFLSGAVFPLPAAPLVIIAGQTVEAYDLLPTTHGVEALRRVLVLGDGIGAIGYELAGLTVLSLLILTAGIVLYQRLQMRSV